MFQLLATMIERLGIIVTIALLLTRFRFFRGMLHREEISWKHQLTAIVFFGSFGIIGTYAGVAFDANTLQFNPWSNELAEDEAIANFRVIGVVLAGLFGGYRVGLGAGFIAGLHRFSLGGFTALPCSLASILAGAIAGFFYKKDKHVKLPVALLIGAGAEAVQMLIILALASPYEKAAALVSVIGVPMIAANGLGAALFLLIIQLVIGDEQKAGALQAQKSLRIADQTLAFLRQGMSRESAEAVCSILYKEMDVTAVSMTDHTHILAHIGKGDDHHKPEYLIQTALTRQVLVSGRLVEARRGELQCDNPDCELESAVIAPLNIRGETVGTIKFYFRSEKDMTRAATEMIVGLSALLSNQIELADADRAHQLKQEAEIKMLQAQISPHFLFNSLNTIVSLTRTDPPQARKLLVHLSHFFRQNLIGTTEKWVTLETELKHVRAYLTIEEARFVDKLSIQYTIDESALDRLVPPLTLQPLVENAVKHGMKEKQAGGVIAIEVRREAGGVRVAVSDNGGGIPSERLGRLGLEKMDSDEGTGMGLYNVDRRLRLMIGEAGCLQVTSGKEGTSISFLLPNEEGGVKHGKSNSRAYRG